MGVPIQHLHQARLWFGWFICAGRASRIKAGAWNFYVPKLNVKLAYPRNGFLNCLHRATPPYEKLMAGGFDGKKVGRYTPEDWKRALGKSTRRRAVENYISAKRLHEAGLGPKPLGICYVSRFSKGLFGPWSETAGILVEDITRLPPKADATEEEIIAAGVTPDGIKSCIRQQINGYVSDLNSVIGVMPVDADEEIEGILRQLAEQVGEFAEEK